MRINKRPESGPSWARPRTRRRLKFGREPGRGGPEAEEEEDGRGQDDCLGASEQWFGMRPRARRRPRRGPERTGGREGTETGSGRAPSVPLGNSLLLLLLSSILLLISRQVVEVGAGE